MMYSMSRSAFRVSWVAITLASSAASANAADDGSSTRGNVPNPERPIIVEGGRSNERFRIPLELRTPPPEYDRLGRAFDPRLACRAIGPMGCGITPNPLLTVGANGAVQFGPAK